MKNKIKILKLSVIPIIALVFSAAFILSGCSFNRIKSIEKTWRVDLQNDDYSENDVAKLAFEYVEFTPDPKNRTVNIDYKLNDGAVETSLPSGAVPAQFSFYHSRCIISFSSNIEDPEYYTNDFIDIDEFTVRMYCCVIFDYDISDTTKAGEKVFVYIFFENNLTDDPGNGGGGGDETPTEKNKYADIITAYEQGGYSTDISENDIDPSLAALITTMKNSYAELGADMCFIGKNLDEPTSIELYMLISAADKSVIDDVENALSGSYAYPLARKNKCIIVYISVVGTPNFAPFENA